MRILQISSARTFGGGEKHFVDLCRELSARGHDVFVALRPTNEWQSRLDFLPPENFLRTSIRNSFGMFSAKRIAGFIEKNDIEIVHAHVARDYLAAGIACRSAKRARLVLTRHVLFPMKAFHRFALRNVDAVIAVSPAVCEHLEKIFPREKIHVVQNGIDTTDRTPPGSPRPGDAFRSFHDIPPGAPLVVTLGELKIQKGQRDFVLAANEIAKANGDCWFVLAGKDNSLDQKFRRELKRLITVLDLEPRFVRLEWLDDTAPLLDAADIFVSPSHSESFGLAMLEAMASGTAVVATQTEGAKLLLGDDQLLSPIKDPLALATRIRSLLDDPGLRQRVGEKLRASARTTYGLDQMVDATEKVYRDITDK